jgi:hypothetical protein
LLFCSGLIRQYFRQKLIFRFLALVLADDGLTAGGHVQEHPVLRQQLLNLQPDEVAAWFNLEVVGHLVSVALDEIASDVLKLLIRKGNEMSLFVFQHFLPDTVSIAALVDVLDLYLSPKEEFAVGNDAVLFVVVVAAVGEVVVLDHGQVEVNVD